MFFAVEDEVYLYSQQKQDLYIKLKKVGKTIRPFRQDLNQIIYDYTIEVTDKFKGLCLVTECLKNHEQRFITLCRRQ